MRELLQETLDVLIELSRNPAFEDDAPEFNEGGFGHSLCSKLREILNGHGNLTLQDGADYTLLPGGCWLTVGNASVNVQHGSDGVGVTLYPLHHELNDSITETWATWAELEPEEICNACGRESFICSTHPCATVIAERNE